MTAPAIDLVVVGSGPAGVATVLAARERAPGWRVLWCRGPQPGFLPAYGGNSVVHRLNVPVERMGLDATAPVDFLDWLRCSHPERAVEPGQFVPRRWFGEYLGARADACGAESVFGSVQCLRREGEAWSVALSATQASGRAEVGEVITAKRVALCLGLPASPPMPSAPAHWIADPWAWWRALGEGPAPLLPSQTVLVVGTGLTAVDMVLGLREKGFAGVIRAVSPGGRWSEAHAPAVALVPEARERLEAALDAVVSARELVQVIRAFCAESPWRAVIDALRADTNLRWASLAPEEQRRLLRHAFGPWNRHRHRMAPDVRARLDADPALVVEPGRIHVDPNGGVWRRHRGIETALDAALVLDCRGPGFRAALAGDSLLARLVRDGVLHAHPFGTGVRMPRDPTLAVVGAARFGEAFETTAVPELRQQAVAVVSRWVDAAG